ncbi:MAG TPA: peptidoglycan-associated lipoprotein Pal [Gammaproteobacteria bacterium]|nr:peptidoglycan-associated lipoprotein Pal [Gammaproteobacteria bacterium]
MKLIKLLVVVLALGWLAACSSTGGSKDGEVTVEDRGTSDAEPSATYEGATTSGVSDYGDLSIKSLSDPNSPLSQRIIYFAYDSDEVAPQDRELIAAHAAFLSANPDVKVSVEGHTDERGAREYNIALGERRAQAVRRMLEFQGVLPQQITTVSYGEEKPAVEGHDESAWSMNRRVELVYVGY